MSDESVQIENNSERRHFEIFVDGTQAGFSTYRDSGDVRSFFHTEIDPEREGHGLGGQLIREALDQTRAAGLRVDPQCPFVKAFIEQHQEYADLVAT